MINTILPDFNLPLADIEIFEKNQTKRVGKYLPPEALEKVLKNVVYLFKVVDEKNKTISICF